MGKKAKKAKRPEVAYSIFNKNKVRNIAWLPHRSQRGCWLDGCVFTTFGTGQHGNRDDLVKVPGITDGWERWGLDPEIAPLIVALNRAGVKTVQSCQDISEFFRGEESDFYDDTIRLGIVVVGWEDFPEVKRTLPVGATGTGGAGDGWLFAADRMPSTSRSCSRGAIAMRGEKRRTSPRRETSHEHRS